MEKSRIAFYEEEIREIINDLKSNNTKDELHKVIIDYLNVHDIEFDFLLDLMKSKDKEIAHYSKLANDYIESDEYSETADDLVDNEVSKITSLEDANLLLNKLDKYDISFWNQVMDLHYVRECSVEQLLFIIAIKQNSPQI